MKQLTYSTIDLLRELRYYGEAFTARAKPDKGVGAWRPTKKEIKKLEKKSSAKSIRST